MHDSANREHAEKNWVAATSLLAAVGLTGLKLVVGLMTGSLGILAEAAHSALDLAAAFVTLVAVRLAGRPADKEHPYGHGKIENLSAMFEALLLLVTCVWIIHEAVDRLLFNPVPVEVTIWSFAVMVVSIVVDYRRSHALMRVAKKYQSQALEADAIHFSTDIWSSSVVLFGLVCTVVGRWIPSAPFLGQADAVAALIVALIVVYVSCELGMRTIWALLDTAPKGMEAQIITATETVPGVTNCHHVRVRYSGSQMFIDIHALMDGNIPLKAAHLITQQIEHAIQAIAPGADVTVHPEPAGEPGMIE